MFLGTKEKCLLPRDKFEALIEQGQRIKYTLTGSLKFSLGITFYSDLHKNQGLHKELSQVTINTEGKTQFHSNMIT